MSYDEPTTVTHQFVPTGTKRTAYYLARPNEDRIYSYDVVGALVQHIVQDGQVVESETKLAYLDGVNVTELHDGPNLVGVYLRDDEPSAADIALARIAWSSYLRQNEIDVALTVALRELQADYDAKRQAERAPGQRMELTNEFTEKARELKAKHQELARAARREAADQERRVTAA